MEEFKYSFPLKTFGKLFCLKSRLSIPTFPPNFTQKLKGIREQVTCCPCVVWNNWATAAKASELGSCGTAGTEFAATCGGSEGTLAGGGGEPGGFQEHRKGCVTPQRPSCSPQQVSAACNLLFIPKGSIYSTPAACSVRSAMNCSAHCSHLHLGCTGTEKLVPHGILAPSSMFILCRFRKALTT